MTKYLDSSFNSPANSSRYVDNFDKVFGYKPEPEPDDAVQYCVAAGAGRKQWLEGPFDSFEKACEVADEAAEFHPHTSVHVVDRPSPVHYLPDCDSLAELAQEAAMDEYDFDDELFYIEQEDRTQAQAELNAWADRWIKNTSIMFVGRKVPR